MGDPLTTGKAIVTAGRLALAVKNKLAEVGNTQVLREAMEVEQRSWRAHRDQLFDQKVAELEERDADIEAKLSLVLADRQFLKVQANIEYEVLREATDERRQMLAHLAAGLLDMDFTINAKARIERAVRALDPEDIEGLRKIATNPDPASRVVREKHPTTFYALLTSGCIAQDPGPLGGAPPKITPLGRRVIRALEGYYLEESYGW